MSCTRVITLAFISLELFPFDYFSIQFHVHSINFGFKKKGNCTIHVTKTKVLISFAVKLIIAFVFA